MRALNVKLSAPLVTHLMPRHSEPLSNYENLKRIRSSFPFARGQLFVRRDSLTTYIFLLQIRNWRRSPQRRWASPEPRQRGAGPGEKARGRPPVRVRSSQTRNHQPEGKSFKGGFRTYNQKIVAGRTNFRQTHQSIREAKKTQKEKISEYLPSFKPKTERVCHSLGTLGNKSINQSITEVFIWRFLLRQDALSKRFSIL